ncbi:YbaB/EbfC family nucleoid-associated protein [Actinopolymorpha sp. B11F2]|uniref:YbaB/EbfC family nucleoid-associated protein n=1 Tax=Actinopolymorpha sp. B11F2 TaxID=3160862 RepID=UPI0032E46F2F
MEEAYLTALMSELEHKISNAAAKLGDLGEAQEYVGTSSDGLVTATVAGASVIVDIHILAKRRLDRHDLGEAIVEAVNDAERRSTETLRVKSIGVVYRSCRVIRWLVRR